MVHPWHRRPGEALDVVDATLATQNEQAARTAWRQRFGEDLPSTLPPGRKPGRMREQRVTVLLTDDEVADLDRLRGPRSRSDFIRESILSHRRAG